MAVEKCCRGATANGRETEAGMKELTIAILVLSQDLLVPRHKTATITARAC
jgi:hypothetical protein